MEVPLHVAASSVLRNLHPEYSARLYFLLTGISPARYDLLRRSLDLTGREHEAHFLAADDTSMFRDFRPLLGSRTPYHRLLLPDLIGDDRFLYLDSDTMTQIDVSPLFTADMGAHAAGFVVHGKVATSLEAKFFLSLGKQPDSPLFNSGAMLFNMPQWRAQECSARIFAFCRQYRDHLQTADQTALNAIFADDCYRMEPQYNVMLHPVMGSKPVPRQGVFHFVGSPKPWDLGGRWLVQYAERWLRQLQRTAVPRADRIPTLHPEAWRRAIKIRGGYRRALTERFTKA
jgi:lipopolysaccharide biosynthesis glycosyltransferase